MYAIVEISGKQFKVSETDLVKVPRQNAEVNDKLQFPNVLLLEKDGKVEVGTPFVKNAAVTASVVEHGRDKKIIVFKKKRRKDYKVKRGHRQGFTLLRIESLKNIKAKSSEKATADSSKAAEKSAAKSTDKKTEKE